VPDIGGKSCSVHNIAHCKAQDPSDGNKCLTCHDGFSLSLNKQTCVRCKKGCQSCEVDNLNVP